MVKYLREFCCMWMFYFSVRGAQSVGPGRERSPEQGGGGGERASPRELQSTHCLVRSARGTQSGQTPHSKQAHGIWAYCFCLVLKKRYLGLGGTTVRVESFQGGNLSRPRRLLIIDIVWATHRGKVGPLFLSPLAPPPPPARPHAPRSFRTKSPTETEHRGRGVGGGVGWGRALG